MRTSVHLFLAIALATLGPVAVAAPPSIERVVIVVIDQCRADYLQRFPMSEVRRIAALGTTFSDATVGHLAAETIVSHPVVATGRLPRNLPWCDEVWRDREGILGPRDEYWLTGWFSPAQMERLFATIPDRGPSLAEVVKAALGGRVYAVGSKDYAAWSLGLAGADAIITLGDPIRDGPARGLRPPVGRSVPPWIERPQANRFHIDARPHHGTAHLEYPQKGDLYVPGADPRHQGGDLWVANVAVEVIGRDPAWRGLLLTMGGVDRVGHMLGEMDGPAHASDPPPFRLGDAVAVADEAVGRIVRALGQRGLLDRTLLVVTSDHGAQSGRYLGRRGPGRSNQNWYVGRARNAAFEDPSPVLAPLASAPGVRMVMADTMVRLWLDDTSLNGIVAAGRVLRAVEGVSAVFGLVDFRYRLLYARDPRPHGHGGAFEDSLARDGPPPAGPGTRLADLLASFAGPAAPDVVGIVEDGVTYGTPGDHGGHQERVQRIPLVIRGPGVPAGLTRGGRARLVDIVPTVARLLGLESRAGYDGVPLLPAGP